MRLRAPCHGPSGQEKGLGLELLALQVGQSALGALEPDSGVRSANLYLVRFLLEKNGYSVAEARDGRTGLELARRLVPAAIILDIQLPVMNGYAVAAALREYETLASVPIIAVTSFAMVGDRERCLAAGATDYVEKPIDPNAFLAKLREHLGA